MAERDRWEYHVETVPGQVIAAARLNALGREGWELVALRTGDETDQLIFKRERR